MILTKKNIKDSFLDAFEELEPRYHSTHQELALERISNQDIPTTNDENWKYFDTTALLNKEFTFSDKTYLNANNLKFSDIKSNRLVFVNGYYDAEQSEILEHSDAIQIGAWSENKEAAHKYIGQLEDSQKSLFTDVNTALVQDGAMIIVGDNQTLKYPVVLQFLVDTAHKNTITQIRNVLVAGENSRFSVIENYTTVGKHDSLFNVVTEAITGHHSHIAHYKIQADIEQAHQINTTQVLMHDESEFENTTVTVRGGMIRNNLNYVIGKRCDAKMNGLYLLNGKTVLDNHTIADHTKPHSQSEERYKGILEDQSKGIFNGKIYVRPDAQKTNAIQSNSNILLSQDAIMDTKPQLEIWADDVKCSHGATTGMIDEDALFYLRGRGIPEKQAKALLMEAFAKEIVERIHVPEVKQIIADMVERRLKIS